MEYAHRFLPERVCLYMEQFADSWLEGDADLLIILLVTVIPTITLLWSLQREVLRRYGYVRYALNRAEFEPQEKKSKLRKCEPRENNNNSNSSDSSSNSSTDEENEYVQDLNEVIAATQQISEESYHHNYNYNTNRGEYDVKNGQVHHTNGYATHDEWTKKIN